ncbi:MAG TPA: methyltransferase [Frankiaceae bacterium]|nr:methyltransferase [Frankiaceae bacterium]
MTSLPPVPPVPPTALAADLRPALFAAGYTASGVSTWLGPVAERALARGEPAAARLACQGGSDLEILIQLFLLAEPVAEVDAEKALGGHGLTSGVLLAEGRGVVAAAIDIRPYGDGWWVVSDLRAPGGGEPLDPDAVVGIGSASVTLVTATPRPSVATALDLGTGCGVQALHLAGPGVTVTATDTSDRALQMAALTAALSDVELELVAGDLFAPVAGRTFDQIVANPPFVIGPDRYTYRDSALPADGLTAAVVGGVAEHLTVGGTATMLASWLAVSGEDWRDRVRSWLPSNCDALVLLREQLDPAEHVALWLADGDESLDAEAPDGTAEAWLLELESQDADGICYGLVLLRRLPADAAPVVSMLDLRDEPQVPSGPRLLAWLERVSALRGADGRSLRLAKAPELRLVRAFDADQDGWGQVGATLSAPGALPASVAVNELLVALVKECEPELPLGAVLDLVAAGTANPKLGVDALPAVLRLVEAGLLVPAG